METDYEDDFHNDIPTTPTAQQNNNDQLSPSNRPTSRAFMMDRLRTRKSVTSLAIQKKTFNNTSSNNNNAEGTGGGAGSSDSIKIRYTDSTSQNIDNNTHSLQVKKESSFNVRGDINESQLSIGIIANNNKPSGSQLSNEQANIRPKQNRNQHPEQPNQMNAGMSASVVTTNHNSNARLLDNRILRNQTKKQSDTLKLPNINASQETFDLRMSYQSGEQTEAQTKSGASMMMVESRESPLESKVQDIRMRNREQIGLRSSAMDQSIFKNQNSILSTNESVNLLKRPTKNLSSNAQSTGNLLLSKPTQSKTVQNSFVDQKSRQRLPTLDLQSMSATTQSQPDVDTDDAINPMIEEEENEDQQPEPLDEEQLLLQENGQLRDQLRQLNQHINEVLESRESNNLLKPYPASAKNQSFMSQTTFLKPSGSDQRLITPSKRPSLLGLPLVNSIDRKPTFASPINSSRHRYLLKKPTALAVNAGGTVNRLNSIMRVVKSRLLQHFDKEQDPESAISVLEKQIETLNNRLFTYQSDYAKLKHRVDKELDNYEIEVKIKKTELDIKEQLRKKEELKRQNQGIIKFNQRMHSVTHHRVTLDDESQYTLGYKHSKKELDMVMNKCEYIKSELERMAAVKEREEEKYKSLQLKMEDYNFELGLIEGPNRSSPILTSSKKAMDQEDPNQIIEKECQNLERQIYKVMRRHEVTTKSFTYELQRQMPQLQLLQDQVAACQGKRDETLNFITEQKLIIEKMYEMIGYANQQDNEDGKNSIYESSSSDEGEQVIPNVAPINIQAAINSNVHSRQITYIDQSQSIDLYSREQSTANKNNPPQKQENNENLHHQMEALMTQLSPIQSERDDYSQKYLNIDENNSQTGQPQQSAAQNQDNYQQESSVTDDNNSVQTFEGGTPAQIRQRQNINQDNRKSLFKPPQQQQSSGRNSTIMIKKEMVTYDKKRLSSSSPKKK